MFNPIYEQPDWRIRKDDGNLTDATWLADQNNQVTTGVAAGDKIRIRINWGESNTADTASTTAPKLQWQVNGGGFFFIDYVACC